MVLKKKLAKIGGYVPLTTLTMSITFQSFGVINVTEYSRPEKCILSALVSDGLLLITVKPEITEKAFLFCFIIIHVFPNLVPSTRT